MHMNKRFKILATVLSILLVFALAACQGTPTTTTTTAKGTTAATTAGTTAGTTKATTVAPQAVTISMLMSGDNTPQADNLVLQEIKKKTGYTLNMTYVPGADKATKLSAMIAAKTLPDLFTVGTNDATQLRDAGLITDLSSILQTYGPNIWKEVGAEIYKAPVNANKKIYLVFRGALGYPMNLSIRTDWLANVGLKMPTDLDSLYNVFKAFTENDPNKNAKKDTYGLAFGLTTGLNGLAPSLVPTVFRLPQHPAG
jgi:putative aldouronate transport system substrate-binding protein